MRLRTTRPIAVSIAALLVATSFVWTGSARAALQAPSLVGPAAGSSHASNPELGWVAVAGAAGYRLQVATSATFASTIYQVDLAVTRHIPSTDLDPGTLHWRVAALAGGIPQAWSAGTFVKVPTLGTPTQVGPADGATMDYPAATVLSWTPVSAAGAYDVEIAGSSTINDQPIRIPTTSLTVQLADEPITWRVRAVSTNERTVGAWSATRHVSASWDTVPTIQSPPDGGPVREAYLAWDPLVGARRYELQVTPAPVDWTSARTVHATSELPAYRFIDPYTPGGGEYAWRIRGVSADGMTTPWTTQRTFEIELSQPPDLLAPADGATANDYPVMRWSPVVRASGYEVDVSTDPTFEQDTISVPTTEPELVASVSFPVALELESGLTYYWRVRPIDDPGDRMASEPSAVRSFTFSPPPIALTAPDNQEFVSVPTFSWEAGWGSRYRVTVRDYAGVVHLAAETEGTTYTPTTLLPTDPLRWRVEALSHDGRIVNASDWRTVIVQPMEVTETEPVITVPPGLSDWVPPTLTWTPVVGAVAYDVRFACDPPTCGRLNDEPLVYPAFTYEGDPYGRGRFDYEIVAYDERGETIGVSQPSHFFWTSPPLADTLPVPGCNAECTVTDTPRLSWTAVDRAERYVLSIYRSGEPIAIAAYPTFATSFRPTSDLPDGSFRWRVQPCSVDWCSTLLPADPDANSFSKSVPAPVLSDPWDGAEFIDFATVAWEDWLTAPDASGTHQSEAIGYSIGGTGTPVVGPADDGLRRTFFTNSDTVVWRIAAGYDIGMGWSAASPVSEARTATIKRPAPVLLTPADDSTHDHAPPLVWSPRTLAHSYEVELYRGDGSDLSGGALVWRAASHSRTAWTGNELGAGMHAWRVRANLGEAGMSDWSPLRTFEIRAEAVDVLAPTSGQSLVQAALTLRWDPSDRAEAYRVEVSSTPSFASTVESVVTSQARWIPRSVLPPGTWHWRVTPLAASGHDLGAPSTASFVLAPPPTATPTPAPTPTPTPTPAADPLVTRISGSDRYATAARVSAVSFGPGVAVAYVSTGAAFPDALAAGPVAARDRGPVLLATRSSVPAATMAELKRLKPGRIVVLGGTSVISAGVMSTLQQVAPTSRVAGTDRYETAARLSATFVPRVPVAYVAVGTSFPDALAGVPATRGRGPLLLVESNRLPTTVARELARLKPQRIVILGGSAVVSNSVASALDAYTTGSVTRHAGANRYETAVAVSRSTFASGSLAYVAVGTNFPDALAGGPPATIRGAPILLVSHDSVPASVGTELRRLGVDRVVILGGTGSVSSSVAAQLQALLE